MHHHDNNSKFICVEIIADESRIIGNLHSHFSSYPHSSLVVSIRQLHHIEQFQNELVTKCLNTQSVLLILMSEIIRLGNFTLGNYMKHLMLIQSLVINSSIIRHTKLSYIPIQCCFYFLHICGCRNKNNILRDFQFPVLHVRNVKVATLSSQQVLS